MVSSSQGSPTPQLRHSPALSLSTVLVYTPTEEQVVTEIALVEEWEKLDSMGSVKFSNTLIL